MTKQEFQHSGGACVGITLELICRITGNRREDAIKKELWSILDENFALHDYNFDWASKDAVGCFGGFIKDIIGGFTDEQIDKICDKLQKELETQFDDSVGNR